MHTEVMTCLEALLPLIVVHDLRSKIQMLHLNYIAGQLQLFVESFELKHAYSSDACCHGSKACQDPPHCFVLEWRFTVKRSYTQQSCGCCMLQHQINTARDAAGWARCTHLQELMIAAAWS